MSYAERKLLNGSEEPELVFQEALEHMDRTIDDLLPSLSDPRQVTIGGRVFDRFSENNSRHAVVLKLVQLTSNLRAGWLLINQGFLYEWVVTQRLLFETLDDIRFLLAENQAGSESRLHERYLNAFYTEDLDEAGGWQVESVRSVPTRHEIREFMNRVEEKDAEEEAFLNNMNRVIYRFGSGYIHGRASSIMNLYDSKEGRFYTNGVDDEEELADEQETLLFLVHLAIRVFYEIRAQWRADEEYLSNSRKLMERLGQITGLLED